MVCVTGVSDDFPEGMQPVSPLAVARSDVSYVCFSSTSRKGCHALASDVILILCFCKWRGGGGWGGLGNGLLRNFLWEDLASCQALHRL